jgi:CheY-like chemotaxis protein
MPHRILAVDDDSHFLSALDRVLSTAGYDVIKATTGHEAVAVLEQRRTEISLAMIDLSLPGLSGFELIGNLTRRPKPIRLIAMTGVFKPPYLDVAREMGAHAALRKPLSGAPIPEVEWLETIRHVLDGTGPVIPN